MSNNLPSLEIRSNIARLIFDLGFPRINPPNIFTDCFVFTDKKDCTDFTSGAAGGLSRIINGHIKNIQIDNFPSGNEFLAAITSAKNYLTSKAVSNWPDVIAEGIGRAVAFNLILACSEEELNDLYLLQRKKIQADLKVMEMTGAKGAARGPKRKEVLDAHRNYITSTESMIIPISAGRMLVALLLDEVGKNNPRAIKAMVSLCSSSPELLLPDTAKENENKKVLFLSNNKGE